MSGNITLPAASFAVLTTRLGLGDSDAADALREAGRTAGSGLAEQFAGNDASLVSSRRFWQEATEAVRGSGLGAIGLEEQAQAWLLLAGEDLAEPAPHGFTAGPEGALVLDIFSPPRDEYKQAGSGFGNQTGDE